MKPKISIIEVTARSSFPTMGKEKLHLWEPTLQTLQNQTLKDFEYIIMDVFYEERKDYFRDHNYGLKIKHIPAGPNVWTDKGVVQICHQFNKGIIHADGELLFFCADSNMHPPTLLERLWQYYTQGWFISLGFGADVTYAYKELLDTARKNTVPTEYYRFLDFHGHIHMDHRYNELYENQARPEGPIPILPQWYYGISTASLEAMLKINGFDEAFDGDGSLNDVDVGSRLAYAGYTKLGMAKECYTIEAYAAKWHDKMIRPEIKCNYCLLLYNKLNHRIRANEGLPSLLEEELIGGICKKKCELLETCNSLGHRGPFYNKNELELYNYWKKYQAQIRFNLQYEREDRISGTEYQEGTFINV